MCFCLKGDSGLGFNLENQQITNAQGNGFGLCFVYFRVGWIMLMAVPQQFHVVLYWRVSSVMHALSGHGGGLADCGNISLV